jgi:hypothetical protein
MVDRKYGSDDSDSCETALRTEMDEPAADIPESHADIAAGRVAPAAETFAEIRTELGLPTFHPDGNANFPNQ